MNTAKILKRPVIVSLAIAMVVASWQSPVLADMVGTIELATQAELQIQRDEVRTFLARGDVRSAMLDYGVSEEAVETRINNLTESELLQIQGQISQLPAGGNVLGIVVSLILIFVLLDLLGATDVFPRI